MVSYQKLVVTYVFSCRLLPVKRNRGQRIVDMDLADGPEQSKLPLLGLKHIKPVAEAPHYS
jgi:hypothetical protein